MKAVRIQYGCFTGFLMVYGYLWWFMSENLWNSELQATNWIWAGSSGIWKCVMVRLIAYFQKKYIWMDHAKREGGESGWLVDFGALREICKSSPWIGWREKWRSTIELFWIPCPFPLIDRRFGGLWWALFCSRRIAGREKLWTKGWWGIILLLLHLIASIVTGQWFMYVFCRVTVDRSGFSLARVIHQFQSLGWSSKRLLLLAAAVFPIGDNWFDQPCQPCGFYCSPRREIMIYMICRVPLLSLGPYMGPMIPVYDLKTLVRWM